jgi:aspartyl-tRNA(Asn)/glutamyl-tRNA(Gln) amidotransferase subunit A
VNLNALTVHEAQALLRRGETTSLELTEAALAQIEALDDTLHAFVTVTADHARAQAQAADALLDENGNSSPPLLGIPAAIKDVINTKGVRTTCSSRMLENYIPPYDATVMERLNAQGMVLVGKTNMDEFAMGSSTEHSAFFTTRNPWDFERVPGGSSGGSAAAVAADEAIFSLGSDTGGSIRQPAALCGVVGMKPTYGRVSRYGLVAFASSLDQIGPFTKDVTDCAIVLESICGHDTRDATSVPQPVPHWQEEMKEDVRGLRLGVPREYFGAGIDPEVEQSVRQAVDQLVDLGVEIEDVSLPHTDHALATYYIIAPAEASANLARYDGIRYGHAAQDAETMWEAYSRTRGEGFGSEVKRRILVGTHALSSGYYDAYYLKAQKVRTLIAADFQQAFERVDAIVCPTSATVAFKIGERVDDPLSMYLSDLYTIPCNVAGLPGISQPCGLVQGLPVGLQFIGKPFDESTLLRLAYAYEQASGATYKPALS